MKFRLNIYRGLLLSGLLITATSCSDSFLDLNNPNQVSDNTFWQSESDALMGLAACYDALQSDHLYDDNVDGGGFGFLMRETSTDNGQHTWGDWMQGSTVSKGTSATTDGCFSNYWNANYELIKRCNLLLSKVEGIPMEDTSKNAIKAEAIALRALGYCNLISLYRDVPYITEPLTLENPEAPKELKKNIVDNILADLKTNNPSLPDKGTEQKGRMSKEAAYAIMGRIALFDARWDDAIEAYNNVIGKVSLFKSGDGSDFEANFRNLFKEENEGCDEVLLSVHFTGPGLKEGSTFGVCWSAPLNAIEASMNLCDDFYCIDGLPIDKSQLFKGSKEKGGHTRENPDYARYENRDPRLKATLMLPGMTWNGKEYTNNLPAKSTACILKWFTPENTANEYDGSLDYYIIRYAEVLLSMAEAKVEKGLPQAEITQYVNEVRARVGMPAVEEVEGKDLSQDQLRDIVRHERRVELAFEDLRLADLYRWGEWKNAVERMKHDKEFYGDDFAVYDFSYRGPQDEVWPIPQGEIDTNKQLVQHDEWK
ncbi:RagB/SusD family nutrient uptake outer membrane protein [uncultured Bacteroides sp.]|jgi:hypothetical protein|uniref:RagB/SusD family nutrient uptake outer membrane protein n=1 Tax=uncultured Bacteroides sp. TaxID=162156 RepID=UPI00263825A4|nr:RagB/SusD family nutrient uptake outer membrane protein [uncultured Bacteroides sp.]